MANANGNKVGKAVRAALAFMFGGKRSNGFVSTAGATKQGEQSRPVAAERVTRLELVHGEKHPRNAPILETEKDGRLYAIALLDAMEDECEEGNARNESPFSAEADEAEADSPTSRLIYRKGPQSDTLKRWMGELYQYGNQASIGGFYVVMSDFLGSVFEGCIPGIAYYVEREQAGEFQPWGSVVYANPENARAALKAGEDSYSIDGQPEPKQSKKEKPKAALLTQKDGRRFAIEVLERLKNIGGDESTVVPFDPDGEEGSRFNPPMYYRTGPQWDGFYKDLSRLLNEGSEDARKGFASIFTDCFADSINMSLESYSEWEKQGYLQDFGRPGSEMPLPSGAAPEQKQPDEKRKPTKRAAKAQELAEAMMKEGAPAIYALLDFGKNYADSAINGMTVQKSVSAMSDKLRSAIVNFAAVAHNAKASAEVKTALVALFDLEALMVDAAQDDAGGEVMELSKRGQARCMFAFAMDAAQAIERAQIAIGATPNEGFLENSYDPSEYN